MPPRLRHNPIPSISLTTNLIVPPYLCLISQSRRFSVTPPVPSQRSEFYDWINGPGVIFKQADDDGPKYISAYDKFTWERKEPERAGPTPSMPFPLNRTFKSMPVLSDQMRELIYIRVEREGRSIRQVSAEFGVSLERVAAVVRLKAVEWRWRSNGEHISTYLTSALERMLPVTHLSRDPHLRQVHESIQELPSHPLASHQTFVPTSESREYTRVDAGAEFGLPPADEAVPLPELVILKREKIVGLSDEECAQRRADRERITAEQMAEKEARAVKRARESKVVEQGRWRWKLKEVKAGQVGFRYGFPHPDRKKGHVKIPTRVA